MANPFCLAVCSEVLPHCAMRSTSLRMMPVRLPIAIKSLLTPLDGLPVREHKHWPIRKQPDMEGDTGGQGENYDPAEVPTLTGFSEYTRCTLRKQAEPESLSSGSRRQHDLA